VALTERSDAELAERFQAGDQAALTTLLERYRRFARAKGRGYFLVGGDHDDIEQEALIGLYKAARDFRPEHLSSFRAFAELCISRHIITAIKTATRQKHQPLNQYVSISASRNTEEPGERSLEELFSVEPDSDPVDKIVADERLGRLRRSMADRLSGLEVEVLSLYVDGNSYAEISHRLDRHVKSIDNALQRIKRKLDQHLEEEDHADRLELVS
jgi:RNA polymerase sporulation-specific sigma factor